MTLKDKRFINWHSSQYENLLSYIRFLYPKEFEIAYNEFDEIQRGN